MGLFSFLFTGFGVQDWDVQGVAGSVFEVLALQDAGIIRLSYVSSQQTCHLHIQASTRGV